MKMDDVEMVRLAKDQFHQPDMVRQRLAALGIAPESAFAARRQPCAGYRIAAGKQRDVVAPPYQFFRQVAHHPLRAAIQAAAGRFRIEGQPVQFACRLLPLICDEGFGQPVPPLLKIRNLHQGWPKLYGSLDDANHVIDDPQQVLLKEIGLEAVERFLQIGGEEPERLRTFRVRGVRRGGERAAGAAP